LLEILIVVGIIGLLFSILAPVGVIVQEQARRTKCRSQLREIVTACKAYATDHKGRWPNALTADSTRVDGIPMVPGAGGGLRGEDDDHKHRGTDSGDDQVVNSSTASLWLLVAGDYLPAEIFVCPTTPDTADLIRNPEEVRDFLSRQQCSYSYQCQLGRPIREHCQLAVLADRSPFFDPYNETDDPEAVSFNHWREGQNVAFADGRVQWMARPCVEATGDWLYRAWSAPDDEEPAGIPEGDDQPRNEADALLM
jgi:type II secretory pathway pseudopilin PulG